MNEISTSNSSLGKLIAQALTAGNYGSPKKETLDFIRNYAGTLNPA
ncbi:MAG: hypothetical protein MJY65_01860 [Bacteroidaceae bacterium]|nr:hypothetical protein [Bacteroidaceae bacterium]